MDSLAARPRVEAAQQIVERRAAQVAGNLVGDHLGQSADHSGNNAFADFTVGPRGRWPLHVHDRAQRCDHLDRPERALIERRLWIENRLHGDED